MGIAAFSSSSPSSQMRMLILPIEKTTSRQSPDSEILIFHKYLITFILTPTLE